MKIINDRDDFYNKVVSLFTERFGNPILQDDFECTFCECGNIIVSKHANDIQIYVSGRTIDYPLDIFNCFCVVTINGNSLFYYGYIDVSEVQLMTNQYYIDRYQNAKHKTIYDCYKKPPFIKEVAQEHIFHEMWQRGGEDYRILSHNTSFLQRDI